MRLLLGFGIVLLMKTLGSRIRFARGTLSQEAFATKIDVSKGSLGGYERDENLPNTDIVLRICQETGVSVEWLLLGAGASRIPAGASGVLGEGQASGTLPSSDAMGAVVQASMLQDGISFISDKKMVCQECARCQRLEERLERLEDERRELNEENRQLWKENSLLNARLSRLKTKGNL